jgi:hypothetical protein
MDEPTTVIISRFMEWYKSLGLSKDEKTEIFLRPMQKVDVDNGKLLQAFVIEVQRQMEKVEEPEDTTPKGLPPIPPVPTP